jgi:hypothetical protein
MYIGIVQKELGAISLILSLIQYPLVGVVPFLVSSRHAKYFCLLFAVSHVIFIGIVWMHPSTQFG